MSGALVLFALAAAACNQSLFASHPGGNPDGGPGGGADADGAPEADASPPASSCPAPCLGDAVAEFGDAQGGTTGRWSYLVDLGAPAGGDYGELSLSEWNGLDAWSSAEDAVVIASCRGESASTCAGLPDSLLLVPDASGARRPALSFRVPETRSIRLSGALRVADGAAVDVPVELIVSRAGRHDAILASRIRTSTEERGIDAVIPALQGDEIVVSVAAAAAPPIGLRLYVTGVDDGASAFPGTCQLAARFDPDDPLVDGCRGVDLVDPNETVDPPGPTAPGPGPSDRLGEARIFTQGQFLVIGNSPLDYSADFTIQFWSRLEEPLLSFRVVQFSDYDADEGGNMFMLDDDQALFCHPTAPLETTCLGGPRPTDAAWHFWRVVRSTADATLRFCIDGIEVAQTPLPADRNLTGFAQPLLGKYAFESAEYAGALDEVRVFAEALPCATN